MSPDQEGKTGNEMTQKKDKFLVAGVVLFCIGVFGFTEFADTAGRTIAYLVFLPILTVGAVLIFWRQRANRGQYMCQR